MPRLVHRTVAVLSCLSRDSASLNALHSETKIHRSTLLRILEALTDEGLVRRSIGDGTYHVTHKLRKWGQRASAADSLAEAACDLLQSYAETVKWPTDVLIPHPGLPCLVVVETNRPQSPFPVKLNQIGRKVPLLPSAAGRTFLAFCSEKKRKTVLDKIISRGNSLYVQPLKYKELHADLERLRESGFGTRMRYFQGGDYRADFDENDGLLALAVPVMSKSRLVAVVNTQWSAKAHNEEQFSKRYLSKQLELARNLSRRITEDTELII